MLLVIPEIIANRIRDHKGIISGGAANIRVVLYSMKPKDIFDDVQCNRQFREHAVDALPIFALIIFTQA